MSNKDFQYLDIIKIYNNVFGHRKISRFRDIFPQKKYENKFHVKDTHKFPFYILIFSTNYEYWPTRTDH
jgi:hypothetical protein